MWNYYAPGMGVIPQLNSGALIRILAGYQLHNADNVALSTEGVGNSPPEQNNLFNC